MADQVDRSTASRGAGPVRQFGEHPEPASVARHRQESAVLGSELVVAHWLDQDGRSRAGRARIVNRSRHGLGLWMATPIAPGAEVRLTGGTTTLGVVQNCRAETEGYIVDLLRQASERRASPRRPVSGVATLMWQDSHGGDHSLRAEVLNASEGGVQILTPRALPVPTIIFLLGKNVEAIAETRYCEARDDMFVIGLRLKAFPDGPATSTTGC